jgi:hypothetical protein
MAPQPPADSGTILGREPALVLAAVQAIISLVIAFGLNLSGVEVGAIMAVSAAVAGLIVRSKVSPV